MATEIYSRICKVEKSHDSALSQWQVMVIDQNWRQRQKLSSLLSPYFKEVELIFDVKDGLKRLGDDRKNKVDLVVFGVVPTEKELENWGGQLRHFPQQPKVLYCSDDMDPSSMKLATALEAHGCLVLSQTDEQIMSELAAAVGEEFQAPESAVSVTESSVAEKAGSINFDNVIAVVPIPEPTDVVIDLKELFSRDKRTKPDEVAAIIERDYKLKNRVLKLVGAPFFGVKVKTKISSISHAINMIGMKPIVNFANLISLNTVISTRTGKITDFAYKYWKYSLANAISCVNLNPHIESFWMEFDTSEAFMLGAIHNSGILLMAKEFPEEYPHMLSEGWRQDHSGCSQCEQENTEYGFDHTHVSLVVAKSWGMPEEFYNAIQYHHDCDFKVEDKKTKAIHDMLILSNYMTNHYMFNNYDYSLMTKKVEPIASGFGESLESMKKMKELVRSQLMANINLIG